MDVTAIAFPNLGIYLNNVPKTFSVFGFTVAIYGVMLATGIMLGFCVGAWSAKDRGLNPDIIWDFAVPAIFFSICGARFYYVATSWEKYKDNPISVLYLRQGGIAIYGAVIAAFITMFVYTKIKKIPYLQYADTAILGLPVGQIIGRWGNFFNREAFGGYSNGLLAMRLPIEAVRSGDMSESIVNNIIDGTNYIQVHPTFFYEGCWNTLLLAFLFFFRKKKKFEGELFLIYILGYGVGRFFVESLRTDQLYIPGTVLPISMVVASVSAVGALGLIIFLRARLPKASYIVSGEPADKISDAPKSNN